MIKPTTIDPLNMADSMTYICNKCGDTDKIYYRFSTENWEKEYEENPIDCPKCGLSLTIE